MKLKNVLVIFLTLALIVSMVGAVSATKTISNSNPSSEFTEVTFAHTTQTYTVTIPSSIDLTAYNTAVVAEVNATNVVLDSGKILCVKAKSTNAWNLTETSNENLKFKYKMEFQKNNTDNFVVATATDEFEILTVATGVGSGKTPLKFTRIEIPPATGTYVDTIYFSVTIANVQSVQTEQPNE